MLIETKFIDYDWLQMKLAWGSVPAIAARLRFEVVTCIYWYAYINLLWVAIVAYVITGTYIAIRRGF